LNGRLRSSAFLFFHCAMQWTSAPNIGEAPLPQHARHCRKTWLSAAGRGAGEGPGDRELAVSALLRRRFGGGIAGWFDSAAEWQAFVTVAAASQSRVFAIGRCRAGCALSWFALAPRLGCALVWARSAWVAQPRLDHPVIAPTANPSRRQDKVRLLARSDDPKLPPNIRIAVERTSFRRESL
jgi:hypothetical protein